MKMFSHLLKPTFVAGQHGTKKVSTSSQRQFKVMVAGAAGGIGQPLSLLLKQNSLVRELALYDINPVIPGVAVDLSHVNTPVMVTGYKGPEQLACAIHCADLILIAAGLPRQPGMSRDDLFNTNASIVRDLTACIAQISPKAIIAIITNAINSMVPIAAEVLKKAGVFDPNRVLGVTTLDLVRTATFIGAINKIDPACVSVTVVGGHSGTTIIPVLSKCQPVLQLAEMDKIVALTKRIQEAGTEVVEAKAGGGSATLSMAFAAAKFAHTILCGLKGESNMTDCAYVNSSVCEAAYFANPLLFGRNGVSKNLGYGTLNAYEQQLLVNAIPELLKNIKEGEDFINKPQQNN